MKKKFLRISALLLAISMVMLVMTGCKKSDEGENKDNKNKTIAVIAKGESHAFWQLVKSGAKDAAEKYGYAITFSVPASEKDIVSQQEMVQTALSSNVSAIVLAAIGEGFANYLSQAYDRKIPVVQFDSGILENDVKALESQNKKPIKSSVATSNSKAGKLAAENFFEAIKEDIKKAETEYVVGVIQHDETQTGIDRTDGFIDKFKELAEKKDETKGKVKIEKEVKQGDADNAYKTALESLSEKKASAIFMSNEGIVKQVYDAIAAAGTKYDGIKFCGFDAGSKQIEWMKKDDGPKLIGSVVQDSYQIGYKAVEQAVFAAEGKENDKEVSVAGAWWNKGNTDKMIEDNLVYEG